MPKFFYTGLILNILLIGLLLLIIFNYPPSVFTKVLFILDSFLLVTLTAGNIKFVKTVEKAKKNKETIQSERAVYRNAIKKSAKFGGVTALIISAKLFLIENK